MQRHYIVVGAHDSLEFLDLAASDPSVTVWAFEPDPDVVARCRSEKQIPPNYNLICKAVSDSPGVREFNICENSTCSSLRGWGDGPRFGEMRQVMVEVVTLAEFLGEMGIREVEYLHVDAQGSDLEVLTGAGEGLRRVRSGQCKSLAPHVEWRLYDGQAGYADIESHLSFHGFETSWAFKTGNGCPGQEVDISFTNRRPGRQVGLLLMRDEEDILAEYLGRAADWCDTILVLDNSDGREGEKICSSFPEVSYYARDRDVIPTASGDYIRGHLYEIAKRLCPEKDWVCLLHPDEFPHGDPLDLLGYTQRQIQNANGIMVKNVNYFPHTSQAATWAWSAGTPIEPLMRWCMWPGHEEFRYFRMDQEIFYKDMYHRVVVPYRENYVVFRPAPEYFHHKHFTIRSLPQIRKRSETRVRSSWQTHGYDKLSGADSIFFEDLTCLGAGGEARQT